MKALATLVKNHPYWLISVSTLIGIGGSLALGIVLEQIFRNSLGLPATVDSFVFTVLVVVSLIIASLGTFLVAWIALITEGITRIVGISIVFIVPVLVEMIDLWYRVMRAYQEFLV